MSRDFTYINTTLKDLSIFRNTSVVILETITQKKKKKQKDEFITKIPIVDNKVFFSFSFTLKEHKNYFIILVFIPRVYI